MLTPAHHDRAIRVPRRHPSALSPALLGGAVIRPSFYTFALPVCLRRCAFALPVCLRRCAFAGVEFVDARFDDSGLASEMTAAGHDVTAAERHAPVDGRPMPLMGYWGESASAWSVAGGPPRTGLSFDRRSTLWVDTFPRAVGRGGESGRQRTKSPLWPERTGWRCQREMARGASLIRPSFYNFNRVSTPAAAVDMCAAPARLAGR
jgi:hypothetical protein